MMLSSLLQVLGMWLFLSQAFGIDITDEWLDEDVKLCGLEFIRTAYFVCQNKDKIKISNNEEPGDTSRLPEETVSFQNEDASPSDTEETTLTERPEQDAQCASRLKAVEELLQKCRNRQSLMPFEKKCCEEGCTRRYIASLCID